MKIQYKIIGLSIIGGVLSWIIDAGIDTLFFYEEPFLKRLTFDIPPHKIFLRLIIAALFLVFGIIVSKFVAKQRQSDEKLEKYRLHLEEMVAEKTNELTIANEKLHDEINHREMTEEELRKNSHDLTERVKELNCFYSISHLVENDLSLEDILQGTVDLIPPACQYPEMACACITLKDKKFKTENFKETQWKLTQDIIVHGDRIGYVEIYYLEERPESDEGLFLKEESNLINSIAERLGGIVERKHAKKILETSETKFRMVFENAGSAIFIAYTETGKILDCNKLAEKLIGRPREEIIGIHQSELHPKNETEKYKAKFASHIQKGHLVDYEGEVQRKDGRKIPVYIAARLMEIEGKKIIVGFFFDITERKKMEKELLKIEKLEAIGVLAGGIAHDFNNLLTVILSNLSLAEVCTKPGNTIFEILQRAKKASQQASRLIKQLLTFSKGGAPITETASIAELIEETASFALRGSNVRCEYSLPDNLWSVEIDKGQISQMIHNLIINAHQAMPDGGVITIGAENTTIKGNISLPLEGGRYVKVSVKDQGTGIPKEHLGKIFDPYFTTKEKGSGLGLASCYSIARNHGGYITVESTVGKGARFDIYLPISDKKVFEVKEIAEKKLYLGNGTILFMDDDKDIINTAQEMLMQLGYEIKIAKNGIEAINMYKRAQESGEPFEAVILDLIVPGAMGGEKTIKRLFEIDPGVKAIVSSGYSNNPVMAEYAKYGFKGVVAKPYEIKELSKVLHEVIRENSFAI